MKLDLRQVSDPVLARTRVRLGIISVALGVVLLVASLSGMIWFVVGGTPLVVRYDQKLEILSPLIWLALAVATIVPSIPNRMVLQLGRLALVLICFTHTLVLAANHAEGMSSFPVLGWNTVFIAVYPLLIPSTPRTTVTVVVTAALTAPLSLLMMQGFGVSIVPTDYLAIVIAPAIGGTIAVLGSQLIYQNTVDLTVFHEHQKLLEAVLLGSSEAFILRNPGGEVVLHNAAAMQLLGECFDGGPEPLRAAIDGGTDGLVAVNAHGRRESFLVTRHRFDLNDLPHTLLRVRTLTEALDAAEVESWKKLIRALSHELNNTLAPMSSTLHSIELMLDRPEHRQRLLGALASLKKRVQHLGDFLAEYAAFSRLPRPRPTAVPWQPFLSRLSYLAEFRVQGALPSHPGHFDVAQIEQVMLNLLKNAAEAGGPLEEIVVTVSTLDGGFEIAVLDRGQGLSDEASERAVLPFWSTKTDGTGLGLALCRDILGAHRGWFSLGNRAGGGVIARIWLPAG